MLTHILHFHAHGCTAISFYYRLLKITNVWLVSTTTYPYLLSLFICLRWVFESQSGNLFGNRKYFSFHLISTGSIEKPAQQQQQLVQPQYCFALRHLLAVLTAQYTINAYSWKLTSSIRSRLVCRKLYWLKQKCIPSVHSMSDRWRKSTASMQLI